MARLLLSFALLLLAPAAFAQQGALTGRVVDAESDLPLPTATVAVWEIAGGDSTFVTGASADMDGAFLVRNLASGRYDVVASFVGYDEERLRDVEVDRGVVDLGTIGLAVSAEALDEVQVTAQRPQVEVQIDRTVYTTADDPVAEGGTVTDVLATLPSVDVDIDGNVSLRGAGNVAVFINGRPAPVSGEFLSSYLQSLPSGVVERVELIPNPSASFEPDGVGGVINIVLKDDADLGLGGTVTAATDTQGGYSATTAVTYGTGPWSLAATYGFRNDERSGGGTSFRINRYASPLTTLDQEEIEDQTRTSHVFNLSADYALSRQTLLTSQAQVGLRDGLETERNTTLRMDAAQDPLLEYERLVEAADGGRSLDLRLGLRHTFGEGHMLTAEGRLDASVEDEEQALTETLLSGTGDVEAPQRTVEDESEREASLQIDYARPLGAFEVEAGYKGDWETTAATLFSESFDPSLGAYTPDVALNNEFDFAETVHALYAQVARQWGPLGVQAGLRYEAAQTTFNLLTTDHDFDNDYQSVFPSVFFTLGPSQSTTFKASYSRRINRPRTWSLNPFPSYDDPLNIRQGNPALRPEYVDALEFGVVQYVPFGSVSLTPYYRHTTDIIRRFSTVRDDGVTVRTFENLDSSDSYGVELITSFDDVGGLQGYVSLEGFRLQTQGTAVDADVSNDAFGWGGRVNASYAIGDRFGIGPLDLQATARYSAPLDTEQGRVGARTWFDLALRQRLLDGRASLTLQARDPFGLAGFAYTLDQPALYQTFERDWGAQQVGLSFSYTFGETERQRDRRRGGRGPEGEGRGGDGEGDFGGDF